MQVRDLWNCTINLVNLFRFAVVFVSTEALRAGLSMVVPSIASGIGFSATGLSLAILHR